MYHIYHPLRKIEIESLAASLITLGVFGHPGYDSANMLLVVGEI